MCTPDKRGGPTDSPYLDIHTAHPNIPDSPESPPPSLLSHEPHSPGARLSPSTSEFSSTVDSEDGEDDDVLMKAAKYMPCEVFHSTQHRIGVRYRYRNNNCSKAIQNFVLLGIFVFVIKMFIDITFITGVAGLEIGRDKSNDKCLVKRQLPPIEQGNVVIDNIFQIPIKTLDAVGTLIKNVRPLVRRTRQRIQQYYSTAGQQQNSNGQQNYNYYGQQQNSNGQQNYNYYGQQYNRLGRQARQVQVEDLPKRTKPSIVVLQSSTN